MIEKTFPITEKLLDTGISLNQQLYDLLTQEAEKLKDRRAPEHLTLLANNKKQIVAQLDQFAKQLAQILLTEQLSVNQTDIAQYFQIAQNAGLDVANAIEQWQAITKLGKNCQVLNEHNGAAIDLLLRHNHRSLQVLRGKSQFGATYGPDGTTRAASLSQSLVSV